MKNNKYVYFLGIFAIILVFLGWKRSLLQASSVSNAQSNVIIQTETPTPPNYKRIEIVVKENKIVSGPQNVQVHKSDSVVLNIASDRENDVYLAGYNKQVELEAGEGEDLSFVANSIGTYTLSLVNPSVVVGSVTVLP